jgi:molecular chaperone HtpG
VREGLVSEMDKDCRDKIAKLARYPSTWTTAQQPADEQRRTGLDDYIGRMSAGQNAIYYATGSSLEAARGSPHLEGFAKKGYEVLFLTEPVDEWVSQHFREYQGKALSSVAKGVDGLVSDDEKKKLEEKAKEFSGFLGDCQKALGDEIAAVTLSSRLTDSPCCLVSGEHGVSAQMEELMRRMGQDVPKQKRTFELNPSHPLVLRLQAMHVANAADENIGKYLQILRDQALLAEGARIADAGAFAKRVQELLLSAVDVPTKSKSKEKEKRAT